MTRKRTSTYAATHFFTCVCAWFCLGATLCTAQESSKPSDDNLPRQAMLSTTEDRAEQPKESFNSYYVEANLVSLDAKQSLASYKGGGELSGSPGSRLGSSTPTKKIDIDLSVESGRLLADLTLTNEKDAADKKTQRIDLTNLRPASIEVDTDKEGRIYYLNLVPTVKSTRIVAKSFQTAANELYRLRFHSSQIMLNNKQNIGDMMATDADYFNLEIVGLASIEFSLRHLKDAKPWGTLYNGRIQIAKPGGDFITISNVTNGPDNRIVSGGPYTVWVRWNKSQSTVEEFRGALKAQRELLVSEKSDGAPNDTRSLHLARIDEIIANLSGPWVAGCGAHDLQKSEYIREE